MGNSSRLANIKTLEQKHEILARRVAQLERRAYLTPAEKLEVSTLKKQKLAAKDQLFEMRRS